MFLLKSDESSCLKCEDVTNGKNGGSFLPAQRAVMLWRNFCSFFLPDGVQTVMMNPQLASAGGRLLSAATTTDTFACFCFPSASRTFSHLVFAHSSTPELWHVWDSAVSSANSRTLAVILDYSVMVPASRDDILSASPRLSDSHHLFLHSWNCHRTAEVCPQTQRLSVISRHFSILNLFFCAR